ncbi:MAG: cytochrome c oxidase subunit 3 [Rhodobacteraceae bacterium]|nr:MAG: cytochrome c oxidase subunit 3 [Paracoccaceae bacterium]
MAHEKNHDFHILSPSIWPITGALGAFIMLAGAVLWMSPRMASTGYDVNQPWVFLAGLALVLFTMFSWWSEVIEESHAGDHTPVVTIGLRYGVIMFIMSEVMFFVAWFWSFFKHALYPMTEGYPKIDGVWPPVGIETFDAFHLPLINTLILLCSGCLCTWAHHALSHENDRNGLKWGLFGAVALGVLFTAFQAYEYSHAAFGFSGNIYGANFFMATGFHGFHVLIGTIFLLVCLFRANAGHFTQERHTGLEAAAWYWHFVDVVWLFLFFAIYIWGG